MTKPPRKSAIEELLAIVNELAGLDIEKDHHGTEQLWPASASVELCKRARKLVGNRDRKNPISTAAKTLSELNAIHREATR